jgi:ADP-ribosylation factor-like protein 1
MLSEDELAGVPLLVFCNKQDVEGALKPEEISEQLGLAGGEKGRDWSVRGSCAVKGEGIEEGLDWCVTNNMVATVTQMGFQACQRYTKEIGPLR